MPLQERTAAERKSVPTELIYQIHGQWVRFVVAGDEIAIGRDARNDLVIEHRSVSRKHAKLHREGLMAMDRITEAVRLSTFVSIPNNHNPTRTLLAVSGFINDDNDFYFGDPLFPRIDEDLWRDINNDGEHGIAGFDDNGDSITDPPFPFWDYDDDEDFSENEDDFDGIDNDFDGMVDESPFNGTDDDGDGVVDDQPDEVDQMGLVNYTFHNNSYC